jgi:hypothetical protein
VDNEQVRVFAGTYGSLHEAELDFTTIKDLHNEKLIGKYEAAVFTKQDDGSVKVVDTDNNSRKRGRRSPHHPPGKPGELPTSARATAR